MNAPVERQKRVIEMDIIRGFALFGVLLVNLTMIDATMYSYVASPLLQVSKINQAASWFIHLFAVGKFYTLFSLLFGLGFYFFLNKPGERVENEKYFKRRLWILMAMGALHLIFVWYGDILHVYAVTGLFLFSTRNKDYKALLKQAAILLFISTVLFTMAQSSSDATYQSDIIQKSIAAYKQPGYFTMVSYRFQNEVPLILLNLIFVIVKILALFSIGYAIGKMNFFNDIKEKLNQIKSFFMITGTLSIVLMIGYVICLTKLGNPQLAVVFDEALTLTGALSYASALILLYNSKYLYIIVKPLAATGQMALTNYLAQTIFFTTFFYGYGFGQFGKHHQIDYIILAFVFFMVQIVLSNLWLKRFKFGPCEWLWRKLTYLQSR